MLHVMHLIERRLPSKARGLRLVVVSALTALLGVGALLLATR